MKKDKYFFDVNPWDITSLINENRNPAQSYIELNKIDNIFKFLDMSPGSKVLDVGCGTGFASLIYPKFRSNDIKVKSIDISEESINLAKRYAQKMGIEQDFFIGDALNLPFKNDYFDGVFCSGLLHHINESKQAIKEMARVGLKVCCVEPNRINPRQIYYQRTDMAIKAGDTKAFFLRDLVNDFRYVGLTNIKTKRINFLLPTFDGKMLEIFIRSQPFFEKFPLINMISGSLVVCGEKD